MSGGSFNYASAASDLEDLVDKQTDVHRLADELVRLAASKMPEASGAADEALTLLADLRAFEIRTKVHLRRLRPVFHAIEWWRSCDWGEEDVRKAVASYNSPERQEVEG